MNATLGDHLAEVRRLLHDPSDRMWSATDKVANINRAIRRRDADTGGNRILIPYTLVLDQDVYTLSLLGNDNVIDVVGIFLITGGARRLMDNYSFTMLTTYWRTWTLATAEPIAWAKYNPTTIYVGPKPGMAYETEWDCCQENGTDLSLMTDQDPLPYPFTEPVPYYAAYLCKMNQRQFPEATTFKEQYFEALRTIEAGKAGMLPSGYPIIGR